MVVDNSKLHAQIQDLGFRLIAINKEAAELLKNLKANVQDQATTIEDNAMTQDVSQEVSSPAVAVESNAYGPADISVEIPNQEVTAAPITDEPIDISVGTPVGALNEAAIDIEGIQPEMQSNEQQVVDVSAPIEKSEPNLDQVETILSRAKAIITEVMEMNQLYKETIDKFHEETEKLKGVIAELEAYEQILKHGQANLNRAMSSETPVMDENKTF